MPDPNEITINKAPRRVQAMLQDGKLVTEIAQSYEVTAGLVLEVQRQVADKFPREDAPGGVRALKVLLDHLDLFKAIADNSASKR